MTEAELITAASAGDEAAFTAIYNQHQGLVRNTVWNTLHDRELVEDVCQEVWVKVFRFLGAFHGESTLATWIVRITVNQCYVQVRGEQRQIKSGPVSMVQIAPEPAQGGFQPVASYMAVEDRSLRNVAVRRDLEKVLQGIAAADRKALAMHYVEGLSWAEIGAELGLTAATAKAKAWKAKRRAGERHRIRPRLLPLAI